MKQGKLNQLKTDSHNYKKLKVLISLYTGKEKGMPSELQSFMIDVHKGIDVKCGCCGNIIFGRKRVGHNEDCKILNNSYKYYK